MSQTDRKRRVGHVPWDRNRGSGAAPTLGGPWAACGSSKPRFASWGTYRRQIGRSDGFRRCAMV